MSQSLIARVNEPPLGAKYQPFWDGCEEEKILITRCSRGHGWYWYPIPFCPVCRTPLVWSDAGTHGTVFTYSVVHRAFVPSAKLPFIVGLIELENAPGVRLVSQIAAPEDWSGESLIGRRAAAQFMPLDGYVLPIFVLSAATGTSEDGQ